MSEGTSLKKATNTVLIHLKLDKTSIGLISSIETATLQEIRSEINAQLSASQLSKLPKEFHFSRRASIISAFQEKTFRVRQIAIRISNKEYLLALTYPDKNVPGVKPGRRRDINLKLVSGKLEATEKISDTKTKITFVHENFEIITSWQKTLPSLKTFFLQKAQQKQAKGAVWVDFQTQNSQTIEELAAIFSLHPLTAEDIASNDCKEKMEFFDTYVFLSVHTRIRQKLFRDGEEVSKIFGEDSLDNCIYVVWSQNLVLTFHHLSSDIIACFLRKLESKRKLENASLKTGWVVHGLLDITVDRLTAQTDEIELALDDLENLTANSEFDNNKDLFKAFAQTKKTIFELKRDIWPKKTLLGSLIGSNVMSVLEEVPKPYFVDILDHLELTNAELDEHRAVVDNLQNFFVGKVSLEMTNASNHSADIVEVLTVITTLTVPLTVGGSLFGMNMRVPFQFSSEQDSLWPFFIFLLVCFVLIFFLILWLKRIGVFFWKRRRG